MSLFHARLIMNLVAGGLLLAALGYDWLGNVAHEIFGTAMFLLLIAHNTFNRRWYGLAVKGGRDARGWLNTASILALLVTMLTLLVTSLMISRTVFSFLPLSSSVGARQIHGLAAYWALLLVSIHLGLRWPLLMAVIRNLLGITRANRVRTMVLRVSAVAIAVYGIHSWMVIGVGSKLMAEIMLSFWNFDEAAVEFFVHHVSIMGLGAFLAYYCTLGIESISFGRTHLLQSRCDPKIQNTRITGDRKYYPIKRFPVFWDWLHHKGTDGLIKIPLEQYEEIIAGRREDELVSWLRDDTNKAALVLDEHADPALVATVTARGYAPDLNEVEQVELGRDPFLIAYGFAAPDSRTIVTFENSSPGKSRARRKVPDVCATMGVACVTLFEVIEALDFTTNWKP